MTEGDGTLAEKLYDDTALDFFSGGALVLRNATPAQAYRSTLHILHQLDRLDARHMLSGKIVGKEVAQLRAAQVHIKIQEMIAAHTPLSPELLQVTFKPLITFFVANGFEPKSTATNLFDIISREGRQSLQQPDKATIEAFLSIMKPFIEPYEK